MDRQEVVALMEGSKSETEWNANTKKVQAAFGGQYPDFWYPAIVASGVATKTAAAFGGDANLHVSTTARRPIENLYGRPTSMPTLKDNERIIAVYDQGLGEKDQPCSSLGDMQSIYDSYASGMALTLRWCIETTTTKSFAV